MRFTGELQEWLPWVIKIRFVIIAFVFAIEYAIRVLVPIPADLISIRNLGIAVILWFVVSLYFLIYNQLSRDYLLQAYLQIFSDLVIMTAIIHVTGDLESNYFSLYLVAIILASILLPRARVFLVAAVSFVMMGTVLELAYFPGLYPEFADRYPVLRFLATSSQAYNVDLSGLQVKIGASLFGFFAVAYLSSYLAESLRKAGAELRDKSGQVASLQARNENIIESMRDGLVTTDPLGIIVEVNPAGLAILGRKAEDVLGGPLRSIFRDYQFEQVPPADISTTRFHEEITYLHPRGEHRILGISASPLIGPHELVEGYVCNFQDLTEEKRKESEYRAKDRMASLGRMAAGIAHEIRNPLASIAGSVKVLQSIAQLDDDQARLIDIVSQESERLNKLVSDFLLYARDQRFEFRQVDLVGLLEEALVLLDHHPLFGTRHRVERKLPRRPLLIVADPDKLRQVFWNIFDNSLKAMPDGGTLTVQVEESRDEKVRVTLGDTGVGFTAAQVEKLFEPFQSGFRNGTGLGLAILYQIVEGHQGRIEVQSEPGKGSRFFIELPRTRPSSPQADTVQSSRSLS